MSLKKMFRILVTINIMFLLVFLCVLVIPVDRKAVKYMNTDISAYEDKNDMPLVGYITNNRMAEFEFYLYDEELYGICLYFYVDGPSDGTINFTLLFDGKVLSEETVDVRELAGLMDTSGLNAREFIINDIGKLSGKYTVKLQGEGISPQTQISFFANKNPEQYLELVNNSYPDYYKALYMVEVRRKTRANVWGAAFALSLSLLLSYVVYVGKKERQSEEFDKI